MQGKSLLSVRKSLQHDSRGGWEDPSSGPVLTGTAGAQEEADAEEHTGELPDAGQPVLSAGKPGGRHIRDRADLSVYAGSSGDRPAHQRAHKAQAAKDHFQVPQSDSWSGGEGQIQETISFGSRDIRTISKRQTGDKKDKKGHGRRCGGSLFCCSNGHDSQGEPGQEPSGQLRGEPAG